MRVIICVNANVSDRISEIFFAVNTIFESDEVEHVTFINPQL